MDSEKFKEILESLKILGTSPNNRSIFLDETHSAVSEAIKSFLNENNISMKYFLMAERVLMRTNLYLAVKKYITSQDYKLWKTILTRLGDPDEFISDYSLERNMRNANLPEGDIVVVKKMIHAAYELFTEGLDIADLKSCCEQLSERFILFIADGQSDLVEDPAVRMVISTVIMNDLSALPKSVIRAKEILKIS